uniref:SSD domain-containing protein n=1 Tax=Syphacia muris TaxID=451379 RepID=A0A0N5ARV1_9BILA
MPLERIISRCFWNLGDFLGRHPVKVIYASILVSIIMSLGLLNFEEVNNVRTEYSPINAPSRYEFQVAKSFLGQKGVMDPLYILIEASDGGSLLRKEYRETVINLSKTLQTNVTVEYKGLNYLYTDLCEPYCDMNVAFLSFLQFYDESDPQTYTYPTIEIYGTHAFIGNNVHVLTLVNGTYIQSFRSAIEALFLVGHPNQRDLLFKWILEAKKETNKEKWNLLTVGMISDSLVSYEVRRMGIETAPLIVGAMVAIIIFVICGSFRQNPARSKPLESLVGCLVPVLALLASTGLISAFGLKFQSIVVASLFLVLSVGVDDVFIILRAWDQTETSAPINERLAKTLEEAGPSITISSLTNALSFAIGITSQTPAVKTFSIYSCIAIVICYFYQLILFSSVLALSGIRERKGYQSLLCCLKANPQAHNRLVEYVTMFQVWLIRSWSRLATKWQTRFVLTTMLLFYYYLSILGIEELRSDISMGKMALPDSYLHEFLYSYETAMRDMMPINLFVMKPGDLRDEHQMKRIKSMLHDYENCIYSYGNASTFFWLNQYQDYLSETSESGEFTYEEIPTFFKSSSYMFMRPLVKVNDTACYQNDPACISSFLVITNFHQVIHYQEMIPAVKAWRRIAAQYSDLDVVPYSDRAPFVDQSMSIETTALWSVVAALLCTATACFIFIPNITCILCAVFSVFSISIGIFGILSHWGVDLDPLSTSALLMAIGLSVDFTAHIIYHYYKTDGSKPEIRLEVALTRIGWPLIQVGLSTIVALLPLVFKQSYLAMVFMKTVTVVVILGLVHGLIIMPAILTAILPYKSGSGKSSVDSSERNSQGSSERSSSFYKTQKLICKREKDCFNGVKEEDSKDGKKHEANVVAPLFPLDMISKGYIHNIELGRPISSKAQGMKF